MKSERYSKFLAGLVASLILVSLLVNPALAAAGVTTRVSLASDGTQGNGNSGYWYSSSISADGRYVAFVSAASNLVSGDTNGYEFKKSTWCLGVLGVLAVQEALFGSGLSACGHLPTATQWQAGAQAGSSGLGSIFDFPKEKFPCGVQ